MQAASSAIDLTAAPNPSDIRPAPRVTSGANACRDGGAGVHPRAARLSVLSPIALAVSGRVPWSAAWLAPVLLFLAPPLLVGWCLALDAVGRVAWTHQHFSAMVVCRAVPSRFRTFADPRGAIRLVPACTRSGFGCGARGSDRGLWSPGVTILDRSLVALAARGLWHRRQVNRTCSPLAAGGGGSIRRSVSMATTYWGRLLAAAAGSGHRGREVTPPHRSITRSRASREAAGSRCLRLWTHGLLAHWKLKIVLSSH